MTSPGPVDLAVRSSGEGPALVVLHGLFGSAANWRTLTRPLGERFTVHLADARNHGDSPHSPVMDYTA